MHVVYDGDTVPIHDIRFVQDKNCQHTSPIPWQGLCCHCRKRKSGDTCRFANIRELFVKGDKYVGQRFISAQSEEPLEFGSFFGEDKSLGKYGSTSTIKASLPHFPEKSLFIGNFQTTIAKALVPLLERELQHLQSPKLIRRPREVLVRATCGRYTILVPSLESNNVTPPLSRYLHDLDFCRVLDGDMLRQGALLRLLR